MPKIRYVVSLLLTTATLLSAQERVITPDTPVGSPELQQWLHSNDPRLVAWGAYFAREDNDEQLLAVVLDELKRRVSAQGLGNSSNPYAERGAVSALLDTLIQRNIAVPEETIGYLKSSFPAQAAILVSRLPIATATPLLMQWYNEGQGESSFRLDRIAAMLLSKAPPPHFAATVLAASEEQLRIFVVAKGAGMSGGMGFGSACGDGMGSQTKPGWPEVFFYLLEENNRSANSLLVESGGDRVTWRRVPSNGGWGSCFFIQPLNAGTRHHLLAEMLGISDKSIPWPTQQSIDITWENRNQFQRELGAAIDAEDAKLRQTAEDLRTRNLLTTEEAKETIPQLAVTIKYAATVPRQSP
jgi:hypothetical protein